MSCHICAQPQQAYRLAYPAWADKAPWGGEQCSFMIAAQAYQSFRSSLALAQICSRSADK